MAADGRRVRKWTSKTRTGCRTCRIRRTKCDEARPSCKKCSSSGRPCQGYEVPAVRSHGANSRAILLPKEEALKSPSSPSAALLDLPSRLGAHELQAFDDFRHQAARHFSGRFSSDFWERLVLQACHRHPSVLHATAAVGCLYRARLALPQSCCHEIRRGNNYQVGLTQYNKAVSSLRAYLESAIDQDKDEMTVIVLITCLLFVSLEMLQADQRAVLFHLVKGLKILFEHRRYRASESSGRRELILQTRSSDPVDQLSDIFVRLDSDSTMFGRRSPYFHPTCHRYRSVFAPDSPDGFESIKEARAYLDALSSAVFRLRGEVLSFVEQSLASTRDNYTDQPRYYCTVFALARRIVIPSHIHFEVRKGKLLRALNVLDCALGTMEIDQQNDHLALLLLQIQHFYPLLVLDSFRDTQEHLSDRFQAAFLRIVELASQYVESNPDEESQFAFGLEPGILASLYFTCLKCRHPLTRRKAIELLRRSTVQEGLWAGKLFASYVERLMNREEQRALEILGPDADLEQVGIPEEARYGDAIVSLDPASPGSRRLLYARYADEKDGALQIVEDCFRT